MGELREAQWAVMSEHGCEASSLDYEQAARLVRKLAGDKVSGLCVITDEAASRLLQNQKLAGGNSSTSPSRPRRQKQIAKN